MHARLGLTLHREARLVDENMQDVPSGQDGELLVRGPTVFRRYKNDAAATSSAFHRGWLRTGDVLHFESDGFLYLTGRRKELIKYKGFQVAPAELEGILTSHDDVVEGVVCAKWDEAQGTELPMAYVVLSGRVGQGAEERRKVLKEIRAFVDGKVSAYKRLRGGVEALEEIPKTASGKVLKRLLPGSIKEAKTAKL